MSGTAWFAIFLLLAVAGLAGIFLYGWRRRKDKMPKVAPLKDEDDWQRWSGGITLFKPAAAGVPV